MFDGNILIIGFGRIALSHVPLLLGYGVHKKQIRVVEKSFVNRFICKTFGLKTDKELTRKQVGDSQYIMVLTPTDAKGKILRKLSSWGYSGELFVEKPLPSCLFTDPLLVEFFEKVNLRVGYMYRFDPFIARLKDIAPRCRRLTILLKSNQFSVASRQVHIGLLEDLGCHVVDAVFFLTGERELEIVSIKPEFVGQVLTRIVIEALSRNTEVLMTIDQNDQSVRKATFEVTVLANDGTLIENNRRSFSANKISIEPLALEYYLRGESYSLQINAFLNKENFTDYSREIANVLEDLEKCLY
ncbi:hypothetical protein [Shewanella sp.]|uniref:hypothetical protein n=1 Tax=Shewanella sp. TaxID=50422 RepID=UPI0040489F24